MEQQHITGLIAPPVTPMLSDGSIDLGKIEKIYEHLVGSGVRGVFVCGTTGESLSLTAMERMAVAKRWVDVARGGGMHDFKVIVHVSANAPGEAVGLTADARALGADGVAMMSPTFFKPRDHEELVGCCAKVAKAAGEVPFYYYHIPKMTGVELSCHGFFELANGRIDNLAGMKYTGDDLMDYGRCVRFADGKYQCMFGRDEFMVAGLALGATGFVGTTFNYAAKLYARIIDAFERGDMDQARIEQGRSADMVAMVRKYRSMANWKAMMKVVGLDCGPVRGAIRNMTEGEVEQLKNDLEEIGFFQWCK